MSASGDTDVDISPWLVGRAAAALFLVGGLVGVLTPLLPSDSVVAPIGVAVSGIAALITGAVIWFLPWQAWPASRSLWLVPAAFAYIALGNHFAAAEPFRYSIYFVLAFVWIGFAHPPRTSVLFTPLFVAAYVIPFYSSGNFSMTGLSSVLVVGPCCVVLGETVAWLSQRARNAQAAFHRELGERRFRSMAQNSFDVLLVLDADGRISYASPALQRIFGYEPAESIGRSMIELIDPADHDWVTRLFRELCAQQDASRSLEFRIRAADGGWRVVQSTGKNLLHDPAVEGVLVDLRDITEQKSLEEQLKHAAFHDSLTGLANRALFSDRVEHAIARWRRTSTDLAVLFLDLDDFKTVNDSLGHAAGDALLVQVADRVRGSLRPGDTAARLGGDEFAILLEDLSSASPEVVAARLLQAIALPLDVQGTPLTIRGSIGIAHPRGSEVTAEEVLRNADVAMYWAKAKGKGRAATFEARMRQAAVERLDLRGELEMALERGEFRLLYQPLVTLQDEKLYGVEALVRWQHPRRGILLPEQFIGLAEEFGSIIPLGSWVIEEACRQASEWDEANPAARDLRIAVNVSPRQLEADGLVAVVTRALSRSGMDPSRLTLEITESVLMEDPDAALRVLNQLKALGVRIAIDDFGTGYSSLSHLHRFPIDTIKIDRSFVARLRSGGEESALIRSIIKLGDSLLMVTVAEGIEHPEELARLRRLGAQVGQGYLFAHPLDPAEVAALLDTTAATAAGSSVGASTRPAASP